MHELIVDISSTLRCHEIKDNSSLRKIENFVFNEKRAASASVEDKMTAVILS